jgi:hypothetical protein
MWKKVNDVLPEKDGRYFVMFTMVPTIIRGEMVRKRWADGCTYTIDDGWRVDLPILNVTHWMEIPELNDGY